MKRVGLYCRELERWGKGTGVYVQEMVYAILNDPDPNFKYYIFLPRKVGSLPGFEQANYVYIPETHRILQDHFFAPQIMNRMHLDVAWLPKNFIPYGLRCKTVVSCHDLAYFFPEYKAYSWTDCLYMRHMFRRSGRLANVLVAISEHTKRDMINILGVSEDKITVIYHGVDDSYKQISDQRILNAVRKRYRLPDQFIFYSGSSTPRKNLDRLFAAFKKVRDRIPHYIVMTAWIVDSERRFLQSIASIEDRVIRLGRIPKANLSVVYNLASLYVHPSLYEGFGLSVLEAQACGIPVLNSNMSCMPEVGGEGAYYVDPYNVEEIADGLVRLATDLQLRRDLIQKGLENVKRFSWRRSARMLQDIFLKC
jgi:glycosyltransferase involved in cell wall biosynthesis